MNIAVILARGGSKRIPGKNIKSFCGKPIIAYSIEAAKRSDAIDRIVVSTDSDSISKVANDYGAEVPFIRPADLSDDYTPTVPVVKHAIEWAQANGWDVNNVCCIYATAPFISSDDITNAYSRFNNEQVTGYVFSATTFPFPIQRSFKINENGYCEMFYPEQENTRSQDLEEAYQDAGQFYWGNAESFRNKKNFFSNDSKPYLLPRYRVQDIDTIEDWTRAEIMWRILSVESSVSV